MFTLRLLTVSCVALVEATLAALVVQVLGADAWGLLLLAVLAGAAADWLVQRWLPAERQGPALLALGALLALWCAKAGGLGDWRLLAGWGALLEQIVSFGRTRDSSAYVVLLGALYAFWRGTRLETAESQRLRLWFGRALLALLLVLGLGTLGITSPETVTSVTGELLVFFASGLVALSLVHALEQASRKGGRPDWRGFGVVITTVGVLLALALLIGLLLGREAGQAAVAIGQTLIVVLVALTAPLALLVLLPLHWLLNLAGLSDAMALLSERIERLQAVQRPFGDQPGGLMVWIGVLISIVAWLLPLALLLGLYLLLRRRGARRQTADEERESVWSWSGARGDLRGLLGRRRPPADGGLRAALARLRGPDPVSRIRRSYIRLLLLGEARERPRPPASTPREYAARSADALSDDADALSALTHTYELARYHPEAATPDDAARAEQAWGAIDRDSRA
jgi:hypothetical protein